MNQQSACSMPVTPWHHIDVGSGRPLVLLHGIGMSRAAWRPVLPLLSTQRRVIAFDTAGFGATPPLPAENTPTVPRLVDGLAESLQAIGIDEPVDIAGNSLGGYMALEAAKRGLARTVVCISPAGLWNEHGSAHVKYLFLGGHKAARLMPGISRRAMRNRWLREFAYAIPIASGARNMTSEDAEQVVNDLIHAEGFAETFANTGPFKNGQNINVPVCIAFGQRDWVLPASSQLRDQLPAHTIWLSPARWGHVPMWQDPQGVSELILKHTE